MIMTREELKALELTDEQINSVMDMNGKVIEKHKADILTTKTELEQTKTELAKRDEDIKELKETSGDAQALKDKFANLEIEYNDYKTKSETREAENKRNSALRLAIAKSGTIDEVALNAHLDLSTLELQEDGTLKGFDDQLQVLKENKKYLFETSLDGSLGGRKKPVPTEKTLQEELEARLYPSKD